MANAPLKERLKRQNHQINKLLVSAHEYDWPKLNKVSEHRNSHVVFFRTIGSLYNLDFRTEGSIVFHLRLEYIKNQPIP